MSEGQNGVLDKRELAELDRLKSKYEKMVEPGMLAKAGKVVASVIPKPLKEAVTNAGETVTEQQFYTEAMKVVATGFKILEEQAAKVTICEKAVIEKANKLSPATPIGSLGELCFMRSYDVAKIASAEKLPSMISSFVEGGATGLFGFAGIVPNIVTSTFCYYRAVQSIAMSYGYDVKNDADELMIASEVFATALAPRGSASGEMAGIIGKIMMISEAEAIKQTVKKGWTEMAARGGVALLLTQMRALAHGAAKKALQKAGKEGFENSVFRSVLEQIGKNLGQKAVQRAIPFVSAVIGALFDTGEMGRVLDFADTFYRKRFILEKGMRQAEFKARSECEGHDVKSGTKFDCLGNAFLG